MTGVRPWWWLLSIIDQQEGRWLNDLSAYKDVCKYSAHPATNRNTHTYTLQRNKRNMTYKYGKNTSKLNWNTISQTNHLLSMFGGQLSYRGKYVLDFFTFTKTSVGWSWRMWPARFTCFFFLFFGRFLLNGWMLCDVFIFSTGSCTLYRRIDGFGVISL